jgi:hypothetical protein
MESQFPKRYPLSCLLEYQTLENVQKLGNHKQQHAFTFTVEKQEKLVDASLLHFTHRP